MRRILIPLLTAVLLCFCLAAAADGDALVLEADTNQLNEGETLQTVLIRDGDPSSGELNYKSSDERIATVDENGVVTGVKKGNVTITAVVKTEKKAYKAQLKITVVRPVTSLSVRTDKLPLYAAEDEAVARYLSSRENTDENALPVLILAVKKSIQLSADLEPRDSSNRNMKLKSSNEDVLSVRKNTITGAAPGESILTISSESNPEVNVRYCVLVVQPVKKLAVEAPDPFVTAGGQMTLHSTATPEDATIQEVTWTSADERILTVDANGTVTGIKRGNGRVIAMAKDGSNVRSNINIKVVQNPESIELSSEEITLDVGKTGSVKATVMPKDTDNKKVTWVSSDENIATVGRDGRIKAVALGECTVTCISQGLESVTAALKVHVQQPVKSIAFSDKSVIVYNGESIQLGWTVEPANATNQELEFKSSNEKILVVDANGIVTGVSAGKADVVACATDGSKRKAKIAVRVGNHVTGISMVRKHAYIDVKENARAGCNIEPKDAINKNVSWESSDESIVTINLDKQGRMYLNGMDYGDAVVTGTTEDGGFQTSIAVTVGDYDKGVSFRDFDFDAEGKFWLKVRNDTDQTITRITAELEMFDGKVGGDLTSLAINTKDGSNKVEIVWKGTLIPGETTGMNHWKMVNYQAPKNGIRSTQGNVTVITYQIDNDWIKTIRKYHRKTRDY